MLSSVTCWLYAFSFIGNIVVTPLKAHSEYRREEDYLGDTMMTADVIMPHCSMYMQMMIP